MKITQISIFLENKKGRLHEACKILGDNKINIRALTIAESQDFGVLRIVVDQPDKSLQLLKTNGFMASLTEIVAVEIPDEPGGLAKILKVFDSTNTNVEYMYAFVEKSSDKAVVVFRFDNPDKAIEILKQNNINVIGKKEVESL